ncbi:MAG: hypothetical protein KYX62_15385 [Pseudomonadota bacterium]|nr:hypothetical protein [Pseudomonadota bacterium]
MKTPAFAGVFVSAAVAVSSAENTAFIACFFTDKKIRRTYILCRVFNIFCCIVALENDRKNGFSVHTGM